MGSNEARRLHLLTKSKTKLLGPGVCSYNFIAPMKMLDMEVWGRVMTATYFTPGAMLPFISCVSPELFF